VNARFWGCFAAQTAGAILLLWNGVPIYRSFLSGEKDPGHRILIGALAIVGLIQPAYWTGRSVRLESPARVPIGHIVLFVGRLAFVFVGGVFSAVFYARPAAAELSLFRLLLLVCVLFSLFCYTLEVERLGKALIRGSAPTTPPAS
jgi:hypothetical protein